MLFNPSRGEFMGSNLYRFMNVTVDFGLGVVR